MTPLRLLPLLIAATLLTVSCSPGRDDRQDLSAADRQLVEQLFAAEDARSAEDAALATFEQGLASNRTEIRRLAVRGLGRLENPDLSGEIAGVLRDDRATEVRAEAANALAQSIFGAGPDAARVVTDSLLAALAQEPEPSVRGAIAQSLGRLSLPVGVVSEVEAALLKVAEDDDAAAVLGALRGFESLTRLQRELTLGNASRDRLAALALGSKAPRSGPAATDLAAARIRRLALAALTAAGAAACDLLEQALADADHEVRRLAVRGLADRVAELAPGHIDQIFQDTEAAVRYQALSSLTPQLEPAAACSLATSAFADSDPHVALLGIDLAGERCASGSGVLAELLRALVTGLPGNRTRAWHRPAHAILALSRLSPHTAAELLPDVAQHPVWQVRMYAARTALQLQDLELLASLTGDPMPNVAEAALAGLVQLSGRDADGAALGALERDDYQLLLSAARALEGTGHPDALEALFATLERVTTGQRETSRDIRSELLARISELGSELGRELRGAEHRRRLEPFLRDFDPAIATQAASILTAWTGEPATPEPQPLLHAPLPTYDELLELATTRVFLDFDGNPDAATVELRLRPFDAPTNTARFVRLAERGYFNGLTFHRVAPNFVIQGGSPNANEYMGDGPFSRDELTADSHLRGTVGLSTRGRDTGDAQIFVNLVDNVRLDHNYTIFADVVDGMEAVDRALEGTVIEGVRLASEGVRLAEQ